MHIRPRHALVLASAVASIALAAAAPAAAAPIQVSGDLVPTSATLVPTQLGANVVLDGVGTHAWTGGFIGTSSIEVELVVHPSGVSTFRGIATFTGTTPCGPATVRLITTGTGQLPFLTGRAETVGPNDVRAQLNVSLVLDPTRGAFVHYAGDVHCD